jgi:hypothetical protein
VNERLWRVLERARQLRADHERALRSAPAAGAARTASATASIAAGDRAFDRVTGQFVEVIHVERQTVLVPAAERTDRGNGDREAS